MKGIEGNGYFGGVEEEVKSTECQEHQSKQSKNQDHFLQNQKFLIYM